MLNILDQIDDANTSVSVYRSTASWAGATRWSVKLRSERDGVELSVEKNGATFEEALRAAWAQFNATASHGLPALMAPTVEATPEPVEPF